MPLPVIDLFEIELDSLGEVQGFVDCAALARDVDLKTSICT